jgi:hypothetical protein
MMSAHTEPLPIGWVMCSMCLCSILHESLPAQGQPVCAGLKEGCLYQHSVSNIKAGVAKGLQNAETWGRATTKHAVRPPDPISPLQG